MRDISFRGKRVDNGEWVYGGYYKDYCYGNTLGEKTYITVWNTFGLGFIENVQVVPETVGQYTGLKDKNGKRVFEGDKIKLTQGIGTVEWSKTQSRFMIWLPKSNKFASFLAGIEYEIIGNIHDNKELLQ